MKQIKYPRTFHLPWSLQVRKEDLVLSDTKAFENKFVVVTEKMDGECTTLYRDYLHARSLESPDHCSQDWIKNYHNKIGWRIPEGWRVCGENLYAVHSIKYNKLRSYFLVFNIWDNKNYCLSWNDTIKWAEILGLYLVPILYIGLWREKIIRSLHYDNCNGEEREGYVVRITDQFYYSDFHKYVAKFVRKDHVVGSDHWRSGPIHQNQLLILRDYYKEQQ